MHDPIGKRRDLRKTLLGGDRPRLYRMFRRNFPEYNWRNQDGQTKYGWHQWWNICDLVEEEWIFKMTGATRSCKGIGMGSPPAWYRRDKNREQRVKNKHSLRRAFIEDDWEDFALPRPRKDVGYLWW